MAQPHTVGDDLDRVPVVPCTPATHPHERRFLQRDRRLVRGRDRAPGAGRPDAGGTTGRTAVTSAGVVYRRPLGDLVLRLCGEFGGQDGLVVFLTRSGGGGPWPADRVTCSGEPRFHSSFCSARTAPTSRMTAVRSGKMPTTSVRRQISLFSRSCGLFDQICRQISRGKAVNASSSCWAASRCSAALGNLASNASRTCRIWRRHRQAVARRCHYRKRSSGHDPPLE